MADFQTQYRINGYKYVAPERTKPCFTHRDHYRDTNARVFKTPRVTVHDCREEVLKEHCEDHTWEAFLFTEGIQCTYDSIINLRKKPEDDDEKAANKQPDKLICEVGDFGFEPGAFNFPRDLAVTREGDIIVADTLNHRIQVFNQSGLLKLVFGRKGSGDAQFLEPTGVALFENENIAIADRKNRRVQIFSPKGRFQFSFSTKDAPFSISCDRDYNVIVGTTKRTVEIYTRQGELMHCFSLPGKKMKVNFFWLTTNDIEEVIVSDPQEHKIIYFKYTGELLYQFQPECSGKGLFCQNAGIFITKQNQLVVADSMNHMVNLYTERGALLQQLAAPIDEIGAVQACAVGPEGHLLVLEFTSNGPHCLKMFRYRPCPCHFKRPGSSRRSSRRNSVASNPAASSSDNADNAGDVLS